jgi:hypothetical protein
VADGVVNPGRGEATADGRNGAPVPPSRLGGGLPQRILTATCGLLLLVVLVPAAANAQSVSIHRGPPRWTNATTAAFVLGSEGGGAIECRVVPEPWEACSEVHTVAGPLAQGRYELEARAADGPGDAEDSWTWRVDLTPPSVPTINEPEALWQPRRHVPVSWMAADDYSGPSRYDIRYDMWTARGSRLADAEWVSETTTTGAPFTATSGRTYCLKATVRDRAGNAAAGWSGERCFAAPLDEAALARHGSWIRRTGRDGYYRGGFIQTRRDGAWARQQIVAKRLLLLATLCPRCGIVTVKWRGEVLKTIDLERRVTRRSAPIPIASFEDAERGWIRLEVASAGEKVRIDGLGTSAR